MKEATTHLALAICEYFLIMCERHTRGKVYTYALRHKTGAAPQGVCADLPSVTFSENRRLETMQLGVAMYIHRVVR